MAVNRSAPAKRATGIARDAAHSSLAAQFQRIAAQYPTRVAIGTGSWQPTYAELDAVSNSLAAAIRESHEAGGRVALLQKLDGFLIGSILGVLKGGQTVVVCNASDPLPSLRRNLAEIEPALIVADPATLALTSQAAPPGVPVINFSDAASHHTGVSLSTSSTSCAPEDLAFLIQTSGSTGRPKWVMQTHRNLLHNDARHNAEMRIQPDDRILLLASPSGSQALATLFSALLNGAAVCPFPVAETGIAGLGEWMRRHDITVYVSAASAFRHFLKTLRPEERFPRIRLVKVGAEVVLGSDLAAAAGHFPEDCAYYCTYSCAEAGNILQQRISRGDAISGVRLPLGNPAADTTVILCDDDGRPVADGGVGEIVVQSEFLSPGYWRDEKRTAERFTDNAAAGTRSYRTGDLGRHEPDGTLSYVGRRDDMVKIRGNRVILGEVEESIKSLPEVQESVVLARPLPDGSLRLAAFVVSRTDMACSAETLRKALSAILPNTMLPGEFIFLDRLPLNESGKIDRGALLARGESDAARHSPDDLATPTEALLSRVWAEVFGAPTGPQTNFFDAGGDSLTAGVVAAKMQAAVDVELDMLDFVGYPRLSDLARRVDELRRASVEPSLPPVERSVQRSPYPLSFAQEGIWKHCQQSLEAHRGYTVARSYGLRGPLNVEVLREAMTRVAADNEILRTTFSSVNGDPLQVVHPAESVELPLVDFSGRSDARERGMARLREEALLPMDLECGPLVRHTLIRIAPLEHWLLRRSHHILYDAWSWKLYFQQLESAYESILRGQAPSPDAEGLQYGDYSAWERNVFPTGSEFRAAFFDWWKSALADQPAALEMPFRGRPISERIFHREPKPSDGWLWGDVKPAIRAQVEELARRESTTHFVIGLAAFAALLAAVTGRNRVTVGTHVTNRGSVALQNMQGNFSRLLPLCLEVPRTGTFLDWLSTVRKQVVDVQAHAQLPWEELWTDLRSQGVDPPEMQVVFGGPGLVLPAKFAGLDLTVHSHRFKGPDSGRHPLAAMPWGFTLSLDLNKPEHQCELTFDARIHHRGKVRSFLRTYMRLLNRLSSAPDQPMEPLLRASF
jgi:amino acid adenylation domain-containing protein